MFKTYLLWIMNRVCLKHTDWVKTHPPTWVTDWRKTQSPTWVTDWGKTQSPNDADDGDGDGGGGVPTTLPSWAQARAHPGQGTNIPFGETPHSDMYMYRCICIRICICICICICIYKAQHMLIRVRGIILPPSPPKIWIKINNWSF